MTAEIQELREEIVELRNALPVPEFFGIAFFAKKIGVSESMCRKSPWILPNWGVSDVPGKKLWSLKTIRGWLDEMTPSERESAWDRLSPQAKATITARRKS